MTNNPSPDSGGSSHSKEVDCSLYKEILQSVAESLRSPDFTSLVGGITFIMDVTTQTYCEQTNQRSLDRSTEMVTVLSYLVLTLLDQHNDPNAIARELARVVDEEAIDIPATLEVPDIFNMDFEVCVEGCESMIMSFDELVESMELPLEDFVALSQDLARLDNAEDIESLFRQIDGE